MRDIPAARELSGPAPLQAIQRDVEALKEVMLESRLVSSPTVEVVPNGDSTYLNIRASASQQSIRKTWG